MADIVRMTELLLAFALVAALAMTILGIVVFDTLSDWRKPLEP